jgi:hypothetical protein
MERALSSQWIAGWVGFRVGMDMMAKRKIPAHSILTLSLTD